ncbi:hypothetical protein NEOLEDRAFT_1142476 [Neolentinus lepideus HHB14362 ss-1]|uniref:Zn(2)-C6 fungal-type domain-containing protein n=1 Tax=Neolentinus lepideus HHB14362 ss-1 TaxID=1314782 RepID=A0A165N3H2_9AGAM|nr:hypothetical protein NEOLEDRAFT_1142476 [Neolentinus lepideus HHB14362 ss-1]
MSDTLHPSNSDNGKNDGTSRKAKKPARACDLCRRKRIRCDGNQGPGNPCSNCVTFKSECTYDEPPKKHGPPKGYTRILEERVALLEDLLRDAGVDTAKALGGPLDKENIRRGVLPEHPSASHTAHYGSRHHLIGNDSVASPTQTHPNSTVNESESETSDDADIHHPMVDKLEGLSLNPMQERFLGKSSGYGLVRAVLIMKAQNTSENLEGSARQSDADTRKEFWTMQPWELSNYTERPPNYQFPEADLLQHLLTVYFENIHSTSPVLHWPSFRRSVHEGLHMRDHRFGAVVLMVCATASRYSNDPRVLLEGQASPQTSGWKWFNEVQAARKSLLAPTTLYDLQLYFLFTLFLLASSAPHAAWIAIGHAIRMAQDVGAHRRKFYGDKRTVKSELWKRAFWVLVVHDRGLSAALGRHYTLSPEDIDTDFPIECDDEYWITADPNEAFKQPPGKPSRIGYFICTLKLNNILCDMLRTLYLDHRHKSSPRRSAEEHRHHQQMMEDMDSALNDWFDAMPNHLRWMPLNGDPITFRQSAMLHIAYYRNQILVHRPFISLQSSSPLSMSCMAICSNAARCIINIADVMRAKGNYSPSTIAPILTAATVLLLQIFGQKPSETLVDSEKAMIEVRKVLDVLETLEERWPIAGTCGDILRGLATIGKLPLPPPRSTFKRHRDTDLPVSSDRIPIRDPTAEQMPKASVSETSEQSYAPTQFSDVASSSQLPINTCRRSSDCPLASPSRTKLSFEGTLSNDCLSSYCSYPGAQSNPEFNSANSRPSGLASTEEMLALSYLSSPSGLSPSLDQGSESAMLDDFMSNIANPNLNASYQHEFYTGNWQGNASGDSPWMNGTASRMSGFDGIITPMWSTMSTETDFVEWGPYLRGGHDAGGGHPSQTGPLQ